MALFYCPDSALRFASGRQKASPSGTYPLIRPTTRMVMELDKRATKKEHIYGEPFGHLQRLTGMSDSTLIHKHLTDIFNDATDEEFSAGANWYGDANTIIRAMAVDIGMSPIRMAGIVAALSPRVRWATNLDAAIRMARAARDGQPQPIVAGLPINRDRAWAIATRHELTTHLNGPKVSAFFQNLTGNEWAVTIDVWMLLAAGVKYANIGNRRDITHAIKNIALDHRLTAAQVQAIIWVTVRDRWALDKHGKIES